MNTFKGHTIIESFTTLFMGVLATFMSVLGAHGSQKRKSDLLELASGTLDSCKLTCGS